LDDTLPDAHIALGSVHLFFDWDWAGAEAELKRAIELNPSSAQAHDLYGLYFAALQKFDPAIAEIRRARDLDPLSLRLYGDLLSTLVTAGRDDDAIRESRAALEREPNFAAAYEWMGMALRPARRQGYCRARGLTSLARTADRAVPGRRGPGRAGPRPRNWCIKSRR
jgi:tetratricopeptide (TPR) repeat protein